MPQYCTGAVDDDNHDCDDDDDGDDDDDDDCQLEWLCCLVLRPTPALFGSRRHFSGVQPMHSKLYLCIWTTVFVYLQTVFV